MRRAGIKCEALLDVVKHLASTVVVHWLVLWQSSELVGRQFKVLLNCTHRHRRVGFFFVQEFLDNWLNLALYKAFGFVVERIQESKLKIYLLDIIELCESCLVVKYVYSAKFLNELLSELVTNRISHVDLNQFCCLVSV